ncbi:unnamed protein product [Gongylonema pulchrum]|uniref:Uncharacterized protein n=1 Tax=Gongylonema pulchrum TaxID=637853 RepID=A0A183D811_9BILA|nr:unnamed protein product [Gongylonema pulchrum]
MHEIRRRHRRDHGLNGRDRSSRSRDRRRGSRKIKREQRDAKDAIARALDRGNSSPTVAVQTDPISSRWPLDSREGLTFPQQIIIPPSRGSTGPDGRPQPQTYQINSEIRISYDQYGRPVVTDNAALPREQQHSQSISSVRQQRQAQVRIITINNRIQVLS